MIRGQALTTGLAAGLVVGMALSGCGVRNANPSSGRADPAPVASSAPGATPRNTATPPPPPVPPAVQSLPTNCVTVLSASELGAILGRPLTGATQFIRGVAQPGIRRTGRVTCRYGVATGRTAGNSAAPPMSPSGPPARTPPAATAPAAGPTADGMVPVEVGLSAYRDPDSASQRVDFTIHDQQAKGAKATDATILGIAGVLLTTATASMLALSYGTLTLALSIDRRVVPAGQVGRVAAAIAKTVLRHLRTATGVPH